jgi:hypothetical protein
MPAIAFPRCRHRGAATEPGVHQCLSPKLVGLKLVTAPMCRTCFCRNHADSAATADVPPRLVACAHLGADTGRRKGGAAVHVCSHPDHRVTTEPSCCTCPEYLFPVLTPHTPVEEVRRHFDLPPRPQPDGWWTWPNVQEAQRRAAAHHIATLPPYPRRFRGRGIVIAGGGRYFPAAYVTVRVLRRVGCTLPIQLWHLAGEVDASMRGILRPLGVRCVNADTVARRHPFRFCEGHWWKGWQLKPYAIVHCSFREVLFLDADCYPARDPTFLFDGPGYRERGAIFWPDLESSRGLFTPQAWALFGVPPVECMPLESGQLLVDKWRCWRELALALHYNAMADFMYRILWGDKDTFLIAWRRLGREYAMLWPSSGWDTHTILQYDDRGEPLFLHRCRDKWRLDRAEFASSPQHFIANQYTPRLAHEDFCFQVLGELGKRWRPPARPPGQGTEAAKA